MYAKLNSCRAKRDLVWEERETSLSDDATETSGIVRRKVCKCVQRDPIQGEERVLK